MHECQSEINFKNPRSLFKYRAFDHRALQTLIDGKIWLAEASSFNDPFDCVFRATENYNDEDLLEFLNARKQDKPDDIQQVRRDFNQMMAHLEKTANTAGVFCLSATPFEPLMWAHYADSHRGFCIEYERRPINELDRCRPVEYVKSDCPILDSRDYLCGNASEVVSRIFMSKAEGWHYEHEWRLIKMWNRPPDDRSHRLNARILSVSFGLRMERRDSLTVINVLRKNEGIKFYKMNRPINRLAMAPVSFEFSENELA